MNVISRVNTVGFVQGLFKKKSQQERDRECDTGTILAVDVRMALALVRSRLHNRGQHSQSADKKCDSFAVDRMSGVITQQKSRALWWASFILMFSVFLVGQKNTIYFYARTISPPFAVADRRVLHREHWRRKSFLCK